MIRISIRTAFLTLLSALGICTAQGQADTSTLEAFSLRDLLNVKVVTASKFSQALGMVPATVIVVSKEQIKARGYQSLLDVMYDLPDVKIDDKMYSSVRNSFTVRGTQGSEKFVILLDGISISSPSGEAMPIMENYPVHLAEQIEIVYGPGSALYGANAVSGVINIISRKLPRKGLTVEASSAAGTYGYSNTTLYLAKKLSDRANFVFSAQYSYDHGVDYSKLYKNDSMLSVASYGTGTVNTIYGPVTPATPMRAKYEAPMETYNIYAAVNIEDFTLSFFRNYFELPTAWGNNTSNALFNKDAYMAQSITTATAGYRRTFGTVTTATLLTVSEYNLTPGTNYRNLYTAMEPAYKYSTNSMIRAEQQVDYKPLEKLHVSAGIAYEKYNSIPQSADLAAPVNRNGHISGAYLGTAAYHRPEGLAAQFYFIKYYNAGGYLQTQYSILKKLHLTLGSRYDYNSRYGRTFNPRLGMVYNASRKTTIKLLYGNAYFAPSPSTAYVQYGSFSTSDSGRTYHSSFLHLPNPGLKPITSRNLELSVRQDVAKNLAVTVNVYYTFLKGLYEFSDDNATTKLYNNSFNGIPVDYIEVFTNNNRQQNYGGNIQLNWKYSFRNISLNSFASLSYVNGKMEKGLTESDETAKDMELDFISPLMFRIGTDLKVRRFTASPRLILLSSQHIAGFGDTTTNLIKRQTIDGYALLNIALRYNATRRISVFTNISNALDARYKSVSFNMDLNRQNTDLMHGQPQDPIRITGGVSVTF